MRLPILLVIGLFTGTLLAADDKKQKDEEAILGAWGAEKIDSGDELADKTFITDLKLTMTFNKGGQVVRLTTRADGTALLSKEENGKAVGFKLDSAKTPKVIDIETGAKSTLTGIYELDGDTLRVCLAKTASTDRPTDFKGDKDKHIMITLKRVKDEKVEEKKDK